MAKSTKKHLPPRRIQSIEVGFRILRVIEAADSDLSLMRIAQLAKMSPSKAYVYLTSFVHEGIIKQTEGSGHYGLGAFGAQLGFAALRRMDVIEISKEELVALREETGCAAHLSVWGNRGPTIAVKVDGKYQGSMVLRVGHVFSLRYSATGRVFLANLPLTVTEPVIALENAAGIEDKPMFPRAQLTEKDDLDQVRRRGYATAEHAASQGFLGIAVPIFDFSGEMVAAVTLLGIKHRVTPEMRAAFPKILRNAAKRISLKLGGHNGKFVDEHRTTRSSAKVLA